MGLDMYLYARKFYSGLNDQRPKEDGFDVVSKDLDAGYWRKHPDLHGYIVREFADGVDDCREIELDADCLSKIMTAISDRLLPHTEGFFFGTSDQTNDQMWEDLNTFQAAHKWLERKEEGVWKSIIYRASW